MPFKKGDLRNGRREMFYRYSNGKELWLRVRGDASKPFVCNYCYTFCDEKHGTKCLPCHKKHTESVRNSKAKRDAPYKQALQEFKANQIQEHGELCRHCKINKPFVIDHIDENLKRHQHDHFTRYGIYYHKNGGIEKYRHDLQTNAQYICQRCNLAKEQQRRKRKREENALLDVSNYPDRECTCCRRTRPASQFLNNFAKTMKFTKTCQTCRDSKFKSRNNPSTLHGKKKAYVAERNEWAKTQKCGCGCGVVIGEQALEWHHFTDVKNGLVTEPQKFTMEALIHEFTLVQPLLYACHKRVTAREAQLPRDSLPNSQEHSQTTQ